MLTASGLDAGPDALAEQVFLPARRGSLQLEMLAATRAAERLPWRVDGTLAAIDAELRAGRPVLVLQNLGVAWPAKWHYAVVVGIDPAAGEVVLRSGRERRRTTDTDLFLRTWRRSDFWAFVALRPGELPAQPVAQRYHRTVADLEATGHLQAARAAWAAAAARWPEDPVPLFGLGNVALALGEAAAAEGWYRQLLDGHPGHLEARNNLAYALAAQGRHEEALATLRDALARTAPDDARRRAVLRDSLRELGEAGALGGGDEAL